MLLDKDASHGWGVGGGGAGVPLLIPCPTYRKFKKMSHRGSDAFISGCEDRKGGGSEGGKQQADVITVACLS